MLRLYFLALILVLGGCAATPAYKDYTAFRTAAPRSIAIVPVINHTAEVEAANLFLTTLAIPLAERGYYVFPTNMVRKLMEQDGLSDANFVHGSDTRRLASLFGADTILYTEVLTWRSTYAITAANTEVKILYTLKDGKTGNLLWQDERPYVHSSQASSGNIFADMIAAAIISAVNNARADYTPVAMSANLMAFTSAGAGLPFGPYSPSQGKDTKEYPSNTALQISNATASAASWPTKSQEKSQAAPAAQ
jgi:hypothetical protein